MWVTISILQKSARNAKEISSMRGLIIQLQFFWGGGRVPSADQTLQDGASVAIKYRVTSQSSEDIS